VGDGGQCARKAHRTKSNERKWGKQSILHLASLTRFYRKFSFESLRESVYTLIVMTHLLKQAFAKAAKLSQSRQNAFAHWVLEELDSEKRWDKAFALSQKHLGLLADQAMREHSTGKTTPLHLR
jgi:hypothetical protein